MEEYSAHGPAWVQYWMYWMGFINLAGILFAFHRVEARWVVIAFVLNGIFMTQYLFPTYGYVRLLGLSHIVFWVPLVWYLIKRGVLSTRESLSDKYLFVVLITIIVSLGFDIVDVARYLMGDTAPMVVLPDSTGS